MGRAYNVIDADGHILEPFDLWNRYTDPKYRVRVLARNPATDSASVLPGFPATGLIWGRKWQDFVRSTFLIAGAE